MPTQENSVVVDSEPLSYVCSHVFQRSRPVLLVSRDDGDWQFLCGGEHQTNEIPHVVGLNHLVEMDGSLDAILDLPPDWEAERASQSEAWERRPLTAENPDRRSEGAP